jgi:hypothetical protein
MARARAPAALAVREPMRCAAAPARRSTPRRSQRLQERPRALPASSGARGRQYRQINTQPAPVLLRSSCQHRPGGTQPCGAERAPGATMRDITSRPQLSSADRRPPPSAALAAAQAILRARGIGGASPPRGRPDGPARAGGNTPGVAPGSAATRARLASAARTPAARAALRFEAAARSPPAQRSAVHDDSHGGEDDGGEDESDAAPPMRPRRRYGPAPGASSDSDEESDAAPRHEAARRARGEAEARVRALSGALARAALLPQFAALPPWLARSSRLR